MAKRGSARLQTVLLVAIGQHVYPVPMTDGLARVIRELDEFIMGTSKVHQTLERLARRLAELDVEFALAGALAVGVRRHLWRAAQASPDR